MKASIGACFRACLPERPKGEKRMIKGVEEGEKQATSQISPEEKKVVRNNSTIKISGAGTLSRVDARELIISGSGRINGPVNVTRMDVSGSAKVSGAINCDEDVKVSGSLRTMNDITAEEVMSSGFLRARNCKCNQFTMNGNTEFEGVLSADRVEESGTIKSKTIKAHEMKFSGVVKAETLEGDSFTLHGSLGSNQVKVRTFELEAVALSTNISMLSADNIKIKVRRRLILPGPAVRIDKIVGKNVTIEGVKCRSITAEQVTIKDRCDIDYIEAESISISGRSSVTEQKIVRPAE